MKFSKTSVFAIMLVIIAVAIAGCSSSSEVTPATGNTPSGSTAAPTTSAVSQTSVPLSDSMTSGSVVAGDRVLSSVPYSWVEYKTVTTSDGKTMTMYLKYTKSGTCTMRLEGEGLATGGMTMDCSAGDSQSQSDPNEIQPDVKFTFAGIEPVTVPAGTYPTSSKYTITLDGQTTTYWTAPNIPAFVKMETSTSDGSFVTVLNGWG